jgi:ubiquinone/menaquinone biosynthesis C-methylase UbiE
MPVEEEWEGLVRPNEALRELGLGPGMVIADLGCGYGTFSIPAARIVGSKGKVYALDIDKEMVKRVGERAKRANLANVETLVGDLNSSGRSGIPRLPVGAADFVLLANVIHGERDKIGLLKRAASIAHPGGTVAVMNWRVAETPRGPPMRMRPRPEQIIRLVVRAGLTNPKILDIPPYHYAVVACRPRL